MWKFWLLRQAHIPANMCLWTHCVFCLYWICVSLYSYHVLLRAYKLRSITVSCVWGRLLSLSAASQWTCSETVYLCWKEESPFQRCLFGSLFPVALCPLLGIYSLAPDVFFPHNGPFVPTHTAAAGPGFVFSAIIRDPAPAMPLVAASLERKCNRIEGKCSKTGDAGKRLAGIRLWRW